jgi:tetratricopeptide (TPR) repeat protein
LTAVSPSGSRVDNPLLGRGFELDELASGLDEARAGRGRLFLLGGDAGIGKTRLAEALAHRAEDTGVDVRWGHCWEGGGAPPFWPWAEVLRAELPEGISGVGPARACDLPGARAAFFHAVVTLLRDRSAEAPMLVVLEDLHAADEPSLRLLHAVARELPSCRVLVVGTYRDTEVRTSTVHHQRISALVRLGRRVAMTALDEDNVATLLERTAGVPSTAGDVARQVHHLTDGNPFFVQEVGRLLASEPQADSVGTLPVPEEVHAVIRRRLEHVADVRQLLTVAAVVGREFDVAVLTRLAGEEGARILDALERATALGVVEEVEAGRWRFTHGLMREALYDDLRPSRRLSLHRQAGEALEASHGEGEPGVAARLAHHFLEAARGGDGTKAVHYCRLAAEQAMAALAFEEAAALYGRALEALAVSPPVDERRRFDLLMALGGAQQRAGDAVPGWETHQRALKIARMLASPELLAEAAIASTGFVESSPDQTPVSVLEEALAALPLGDSPLRARLLTRLGRCMQMSRLPAVGASRRTVERGQKLADEGVAMARRVGDRDCLRAVLEEWHAAATASPGLLEERLQVADELVGLATAAGDSERLALARQWRACDLFALGHIDAMATEIQVARMEAQRLRMPFLLWGVVMEQAGLALLRGALDDAEARAGEARVWGERAELPGANVAFERQLRELRRHQGRLSELERLPRVPGCRGFILTTITAWGGRRDDAAGIFEEMMAGVTPQRLSSMPAPCLVNLAEAAWAVGSPARALETAAALEPYAGRHVTVGVANHSLGAADRALGQLAALRGRYDEADARFEVAHRLHARLGTPLWDGYARADHARALLMRDGPGDRGRAERLVEEARRRFRELGMDFHESRAAALLAQQPAEAVTAGMGVAVDRARLSLEGEYWVFEYGGAVARLRDSKGVRYLAELLRHPGRELHALDLVTGRTHADDAGAGGTVLDPVAKEGYRRRLQDLREEIDEATAFNDLARAERAQVEMDHLITELTAAVGMGKHDGRTASEAERARQSVSRAVKGTVERLADANPALGEHLRSTVRTGVYSAYVPDPRAPIAWEG